MPSITPATVQIDYTKYFSKESHGRIRSQLKELRPYHSVPDMISLGGGLPHPSTWPVNGMTLSVPFAGKSVFVPGYNGRSEDALLPLEPYTAPLKTDSLSPDLAEELQYGSTYGPRHLVNWCKEHIQRIHSPRYADWEVLSTAGNTDGMDGILRSLFDKGEYLLVEEFAYPGLLSPATSMGIRCLGVPMDTEGVNPLALDEIMSTWNEVERGGPRPKMIALVPTCSNPCGVTINEQRKIELYAICRKWDLLIAEDDPYCFLQIRPADKFIEPTFLSMDTDGRVIRIDSFSKIVAPGSRMGWITGPRVLVEKIMQSRESSTNCPSGFSVSAITAILRAWGGHEGFEQKYIPHIASIYTERCLAMVSYLKAHVSPKLIDYPTPSGGMFLWVRLKVETHPDVATKTPDEISKELFHKCIEHKVLIVPGHFFKAPQSVVSTREEDAKKVFVRISFSLPPLDRMEEAARRFGKALAEAWGVEL
ncbi:pyridoxal phosphate-dependent transferase [Naematelia encephala]|uniref:Pyridoxal phosphate-dependent transferase n=1 Tax=Naematelia encephala TaxID=71784 RepID=A0A1Y2AZG7_9TREE|nr:pyridoxal phosphate-dependent transferase [Naematelia encephala]